MNDVVTVPDGTRIGVTDTGAGAPIVLLAGWGLDGRVWHRQAARLHATHRIITVDLRGHGRSDAPHSGYEIEQLAADVADVLDVLDAEHATVVGWSLGGQTAFRLAAARTDLVSRLVLVSTNAVRASRGEGYPFGAEASAFLPALLSAERGPRWLSARRKMLVDGITADVDPLLVDWLLGIQHGLPTWAGAACFEQMFTDDACALIPHVVAPTVLVAGTRDPMFSRRAADWLIAQLRDARFIAIEGSGHFPMFEDADLFDEVLDSVL